MSEPQENKSIAGPVQHPPVVAIGASAGGIEAITNLLHYLTSDSGMAFVYIQHLNRNLESNLVSVLQRATSMQVTEVEEGMRIAANQLFIIPPNTDMTLDEGIFKLNKRAVGPVKHSPIDVFFLSLAANPQDGMVGILLSGSASDGAMGLKAIRRSGGITYVQDDSAMFKSMPQSALAEDAADAVLSPEEIAAELVRLSQKDLVPAIQLGEGEDEEQEAMRPERSRLKFKEEDFTQILKMLKSACRVDFSHYKKNTISRRIARRMVLHKCDDMGQYVDYLKKNKPEINLLYQDMLINVTHFFRDNAASEFLKNEVLSRIIKSKTSNSPLRIWVPACSTGEEAFSLAILILEALGSNTVKAVQIFATDLSESAIAKARLGIYSTADLIDVSENRINNFFTKVDNDYRVIKRIRDFCVFAPHNVLTDPPFSRVDIISCCNLLIYLDTTLQKKILTNFHYALNDKGILVLGKSETVGDSANLFTSLDKKVKIFAKKSEVPAKPAFDLSYRGQVDTELPVQKSEQVNNVKEGNIPQNLEKIIDNLLLNDYVPASVVVNSDLDILHFRGSTGLYLEPSSGRASLNLLKMARLGLQLELRNAVQTVLRTGDRVAVKDLDITHQGDIHRVSFEVAPVSANDHGRVLLIVFKEGQRENPEQQAVSFNRDRRVKQLEKELVTLRQEMRSVLEEQEAANEELQSANEEIVSSNEELQSINEELETSKEELESGNEELQTINYELQIRNEQLGEAQDYAQNVIATIRESALVLDRSLLVKVANESFYRTFNIKPDDTEGKLIYEVGGGMWQLPRLKDLLEQVLPAKNQVHAYEVKSTFDGVGEKVLLLNARKVINLHSQQFIFLAIEDITEHRQAERLLEEREAWLRNMTNNVPVMIWVADAQKSFTFLNNTWLSFTGRSITKEIGIGWTEGVYSPDLDPVLSTYHSNFNERRPFSVEYRMRRHDGNYRWILNTAVPTFSSENEFTGYIGSCIEIHDKRVMNEELEKLVTERTGELQEANKNLERSNNELAQFAYIASHDLQEPLRKIVTFSNRLREQFDKPANANALNYIEKIVFSSERMRQLIDDLLNFSRITRFDKKFVSTDLNKVLANVLIDFDLMIQEKNGRVNARQLPVIDAIPLHINQLFYNLVGNALKFIKPGEPPVITIESRQLTGEEVMKHPELNAEQTHFEITFTDNGIGFPQEFAGQIFVIFQRLNEKEAYPGTGIGLALCHKIVDNHNGIIYAESKEGRGAKFYIVLPEKQSF